MKNLAHNPYKKESYRLLNFNKIFVKRYGESWDRFDTEIYNDAWIFITISMRPNIMWNWSLINENIRNEKYNI